MFVDDNNKIKHTIAIQIRRNPKEMKLHIQSLEIIRPFHDLKGLLLVKRR